MGGEGKAESGLDKGGDGGKEAESSAAEAEQAEQENTETWPVVAINQTACS